MQGIQIQGGNSKLILKKPISTRIAHQASMHFKKPWELSLLHSSVSVNRSARTAPTQQALLYLCLRRGIGPRPDLRRSARVRRTRPRAAVLLEMLPPRIELLKGDPEFARNFHHRPVGCFSEAHGFALALFADFLNRVLHPRSDGSRPTPD